MIDLNVNGRTHGITADPDTPLLYVLREELQLNAAKFGCGLGQCGACTVLVDGAATLSCVTPIMLLEGRQITTVEGLGTAGNPGPLQQAFIEEQAAQCGFCIAGMMMRAQELLQRNRRPTDSEIRTQLEPNLCRCGTHMRILRAVRRAAFLMGSSEATASQGARARSPGEAAAPTTGEGAAPTTGASVLPSQAGALQGGEAERGADALRKPAHPEQRERPER